MLDQHRSWPIGLLSYRQRSRTAQNRGFDKGAITMDFTSGVMPTTLTLTRSSSATFVNNIGRVVVAGVNGARFEFQNGIAHLLIEGQATNLLNFSETFATTGGTKNNWADTTITRDGTLQTSPRNDATALRITAAAGNATVISTAAIGTIALRTFSIWMRRVTGSGAIELTNDNGVTWTARTITSTWARYTLTSTVDHRVGVRIVTSGDAIEIWGAQLEVGQIETSYIQTTTATNVRSADTVVTNNWTSGGLRWPQYSTTVGTMYVEAAYRFRGVAGGYPRPVNFISATPTIAFGLFADVNATSPNNLGPECQTDLGVLFTNTANTDATMFKHAFTAYSTGLSVNIDQAISGVAGSSATSTASPTLNASNLHINWLANNDMPVMRLRKISYWPKRMSISELRQITVH